MGSNCAHRQFQRVRDLLVTSLLLMIEHEHRPLNVAEVLQLPFDQLLELLLRQLFLCVEPGVGEPILPIGVAILVRVDKSRDRHQRPLHPAPALPFVLCDVGHDTVEVGGQQGLSAKCRQCSVEPEKDFLRQVLNMFAAAIQPQEGAKDHLLMVADDLLET